MADLTLKQRFGENVSFNASSKTLTINLADLSSIIVGGVDVGLNVSAMTVANQDEYASRISWALLQLQLQNQPESNTDETVGVYITNEGRRNITRNQTAQHGFRLTATAYKNDTVGNSLDPDEIGA